MTRSIKELLKLVLVHLRAAFEDPKDDADGLCYMSDYLWDHELVNLDEYEALDYFLSDHFSKDGYRWFPAMIEPRETWLKTMIDEDKV